MTGRRSAFTLLELVIVIAIICILMSLTMSVIVAAGNRQAEVNTSIEIRKLDGAVASLTWNGDPPPSKLFVANDPAEYNKSDPLHAASFEFLQRRFFGTSGWTGPVNWGAPVGGVILEGDQCLVFLLGGLQKTDASGQRMCLGFSRDPKDPTNVSAGMKRPAFDFEGSRLTAMRPGNPFFSYLDYYRKKPYAYFSSGGGKNRYSAVSDCGFLGVSPYKEKWSPPLYVKAEGVQIISAGRDGEFGPGTLSSATVWNASAGTADAKAQDDLANFHPHRLGVSN